jgi:hypothetical protein
MLSSIYCRLLSPKFKNDEEIDELFERVKTLICLHEGLYPISESLVVWHQLLDITIHIKKFGPMKSWWEFSGERSLTGIKEHLQIGGSSFDKSIMRKYSEHENLILNDSYNFSIENIHTHHPQNNDLNSRNNFSVRNEKMYYSDESFLLYDKIDYNKKNIFNKF